MFRIFIGWPHGGGLARVGWRPWLAVCCTAGVLCSGSVSAQVFVTGPYGPGGTWNLYELRGAGTTRARFANGGDSSWHTFLDANVIANASHESVTGKNAHGHLAALGSPQEGAFLKSQQSPWAFWIGLSDDEAFGGSESSSSPPNPADDGKVGLGGPPGDGIGWKWTDGEPFTYTDWAKGEPDGKRADEDYVQLSSDGWRVARDQPAPFIVEYETELASDFQPPAPVAQHLPGPGGAEGLWGVRELYVPALGPETDLNTALTRLFQPPSGAIVRDYQTPVLSYADGYPHPVISDSLLTGDRRRFEIVRRGEVASAENLQLVAHGTIRIPVGREGTWEFAVNSDDGFELWIDGAKFNGPASRVTSYGSLIDPNMHPLSRSQGTVQLGPGDHDVEVVYFNGPSAAAFGLQAKGPGDKQFALVGDPGRDLVGTIPAVAGGFALTQVQRHAGELADLSAARSLIAAPGPLDQVDAASVNSVNFGDPYGEERGWFGGNQTLPGPQQPSDAFALEARGILHVPQDGQFTFGFDSLSGVQLTIEGATFTDVAGAGAISPDGHSIVAEDAIVPALTTAMTTLSAGDYPISLLTYKNFGAPAFVELFAAPGAQHEFSPDAFRVLTNKVQAIDLHRPAGLQLVPEPSGIALGLSAGLAAAIVLRRRTRSAWNWRSLRIVAGRLSWALLVAACAASIEFGCADAAEFVPLGSLPGDLRTDVHGVSADGSAVVGGTFTDQGRAAHAFLWTKQGGLEDLGALVPGGLSAATAISGDGSVIVGGSSSSRTPPNSTEAFRWTRGEGMAPLGDLPDGTFISSATGVSFDGSVIVGAGTTKRGAEAFRWTSETGMQGMGIPDWATLSAAFDVSGDGQRTLGQDHFDVFQAGGNYWSFVAPPSGPFARIENPAGVRSNLGVAISRDGQVVVGASNRIVGDSVLETPFRWSEQTGLVELDNAPNSFARVFDVSADGSRIVGQVSLAGTAVPAIWDPLHGFRDLQAILSQDPAIAAALAGWKLKLATAISDDGTVVAGTGIDPQGHRAGWRAVLDPEPALSLLPGDANLDSVVDLADFGLLKAHFGRPGFWYQGNFDADPAINLNDFGLLKANFAVNVGPAVPEPQAVVLALIAFALSLSIDLASSRWPPSGARRERARPSGNVLSRT